MIWFLGDVHGDTGHILPAIKAAGASARPSALVFLGDIEMDVPFSEFAKRIYASAGVQCWFIPGNHDTDHARFLDNLSDPDSAALNLHGRVVEIDGRRVAGLGGIFRQDIWHPDAESGEPSFLSHSEYEENLRSRSRGFGEIEENKLLKHRSTIFYEDYAEIYGQPADILVTHEAPGCHPHGFSLIDDLARSMGAALAFHGHQHDRLDYSRFFGDIGFKAYGVGLCGITDCSGAMVRPGKFDEARNALRA